MANKRTKNPAFLLTALLLLLLILAFLSLDVGRTVTVEAKLDRAMDKATNAAVRMAMRCGTEEADVEEAARREFTSGFEPEPIGDRRDGQFQAEYLKEQGTLKLKASARIKNRGLKRLAGPASTVKRDRIIWNVRDYGVSKLGLKPELDGGCVIRVPRN